MYNMEALESILAIIGGALIFVVILLIAWLVFYFVGAWKFYVKTGREGWKAIIPYYNNWVLVEMAGLKWYWFLLAQAATIFSLLGFHGALATIASLVSMAAGFNISYNLSKKLNKDVGYAIVLWLFQGILLPILGFSNSTVWNESAPVTGDGLVDNIIDKTKNNNNTNGTNTTNNNNASSTTDINNTNGTNTNSDTNSTNSNNAN